MAPNYIQQTQLSGTRNGQEWPGIGKSIDLPVEEAADYLAAGYVVAAPSSAEVIETAIATGQVETATKPSGRRSTKAAIAEADAARAAEVEAAAAAAATGDDSAQAEGDAAAAEADAAAPADTPAAD